jgi:hypothetical protein
MKVGLRIIVAGSLAALASGAERGLAQDADTPVGIGSRLELLVDGHLIAHMEGVRLQPHAPQLSPLSARPLPKSAYATVIKDGNRYRAWYRSNIAGYTGDTRDGNPGEITCYAESADGVDWDEPELDLIEVNGSRANNVVLHESPFCHNFSPFLDTRPGRERGMKFKALAGSHDTHQRYSSGGLHAFGSDDGLRWTPLSDKPVIAVEDFAFDSQNVAFWSETEGCYVCYFRTWTPPPARLRTISRTVSQDFLNWSAPVATQPNRPGEHLYTSQAHPYFRAPHIYLAFPTRYTAGRVGGQKTHGMLGSTDILFMSARAGAPAFDRLFTEAYIRPGLDPARWGNRANYVALNVVPTGPAEISIYHAVSRHRYVLRTDGFVSARAGMGGGTLTTKRLIFTAAGPSAALLLNASTSAAGSIRCEVRDAAGAPVPGFSLADCVPLYGDGIELPVAWKNGTDVKALAGKPVTLHFELRDCDLFAYRFGLPSKEK